MADLGTAVRGYLIANAGVLALTSTRIFPDVLPQGYTVASGGALTYTTIDTIHDHLINGLSGIARSRIEFAACSGTRAGANAIAEAVRSSGLVGTTGLVGGVWFESVMIDSGVQTLDERPTDGSQEHRYFTVFDYIIAYQESAQMPTGTRFKTGNSATLTLGGVLTTGVTTAWVGNIVSINPGEWTLGERDVSLLLDTGFLRVDPHDLAVTNEVAGVTRYSSAVGVPTIGSGVDTATITLPQNSTATSGVTRGNIAGKAFFSRVSFPQLANNETMDSEFTLKMTGESLAYTKEA